jgi:hypothetical protein
MISISNTMVSSAIWIKHARVSCSKRIKITSPKDECYLRSLKNRRVLVLSKFHEKSSYNVLIIYIKMFETIVVLTYVHSEPSTDKVFLLCYITKLETFSQICFASLV